MKVKKIPKFVKTKIMSEDKKTLSQEFAIFLKAKRMSQGLTTRKLAMKIYGTESRAGYISKIETGKLEITVTSMGEILECLNSWVEFIE